MAHDHRNPETLLYAASRNGYAQVVTSTGTKQWHVSGIVALAPDRKWSARMKRAFEPVVS